ncbi:hypothetical protein L1049_000344 [Liquidambar formosana]|uniref:Omega-hydroxypalmitate O-feruloyl transferase n=1 Tax=Liquidambar formosana TaxID=63359 RepID=A0AAP0R4R4_LIQFO
MTARVAEGEISAVYKELAPMEGTCDKRGITSIKKLEPILIQPEMESHGDEFYFLSNIDQDIAGIVQTLYCFKLDDSNCGQPVSDVIKQALAKVLAHYYPLAGSLTISSDAFANDDIEVLGDITVPDPAMTGKLVYTIPEAKSLLEMPLLAAQVTRFKCGGFVLGLAINHCMTDGISATEFVNSWGETARGISLTVPPFLDRSTLRSRQPPEMLYESFHFDSEMLARLKKLAMEDGAISSCTSFTVLTALVWRARSRALKMKPHQQTKLIFSVDGRSKFNPPLPKGYFGNGIVVPCCLCTAGELIEKPFSFVVDLVQNAKEKVTEDYIRSAIDFFEESRPKVSLTATLLLSSWTRLPFDTVDFGWGEPTQFGSAKMRKESVFFLPNGKKKKGITLLLGLPHIAMKTFQELMQV